MDLKRHITNNKFSIKVVPNSSKTEILEDNGVLKLYLKAIPDKGKANAELIKFFKKEYKLSVSIKSGKTNRKKIIEILL
jgi:uncharacterized protein